MKVDKLYKKQNNKSLMTRNYQPFNPEFKWKRNSKEMKNFDGNKQSMTSKKHERDYTPLFLFLIASVGNKADDVYSIAKRRSDERFQEYWNYMFDGSEFHRMGENSYYSGLMIDENGLIQKVDPTLEGRLDQFMYDAGYDKWTQSFNGKVYKPNK